jgi:hypothetical protein
VLIPEDLTEPERRVWDAIETGALVSLLDGGTDEERDPSNGAGWGPERTVRGDVLVEMLTHPGKPDARPPGAVRLQLARITGALDLEARDLLCPLDLRECYLDEPVNVSEARAPKLGLTDCHLSAFVGHQLETRGSVTLDGSHTEMVVLAGAKIGGQLSLNMAHIMNPDGEAFSADGIRIGGGMFCRQGFRAEGELRLPGAHIDGPLDLSQAQLTNPNGCALCADTIQVVGDMVLDRVRAEGELRLPDARSSGQLSLVGAQLINTDGCALTVDGGEIESSVFCADGFNAEGELRLVGTHIGGQLNLNGAHLTNPQGYALTADRIRVDRSVVCLDGFSAEGELRLMGGHIGGQLNLSGAQLTNPRRIALAADGVHIAGDMFCRDGFRAEGELRLPGAYIGGQLDFSGAQLTNPEDYALNAPRARVGEDVFCRDGFHSEGELYLLGAHIGGLLGLDGILNNPAGNALRADAAQIDGGLICSERAKVEGEVRLLGAHIGGQLSLSGAQLSNPGGLALDLEQATVSHLMLSSATKLIGTVNLTDARVTRLDDSWPYAPYRGRIGGLTYESLTPLPGDMSLRLDWLSKAEGGHAPQPYEQLAAVLRRAGRDDDAREVAIAKERNRRSELKFAGRAWNWFLAVTVRYGYQPWRGALWLGLLALIGWPVFGWAKAHHHFVALNEPGQSLPQFHPWLYSLDSVLPVINLGQKSYWSATGAAQYWQAFSVLAGWILVTVILAAVTTRLIRD